MVNGFNNILGGSLLHLGVDTKRTNWRTSEFVASLDFIDNSFNVPSKNSKLALASSSQVIEFI